jgi:hypothetical protein
MMLLYVVVVDVVVVIKGGENKTHEKQERKNWTDPTLMSFFSNQQTKLWKCPLVWKGRVERKKDGKRLGFLRFGRRGPRVLPKRGE